MKITKLSNGMKVLLVEKQGNATTIMVNVAVGSNHEPLHLLGVSHFIEHMVFEGTKKRKDATAIANDIENIGGDLNAATTNDRTYFYTTVLNKHVNIALDVLADIMLNPVFEPKVLEKERNVVLDEVNMVNDEPRFYQWILFQKALFTKHPVKHPVYGTVKTIKSMTRKDMMVYHRKHYVPGNMIITVVGKTSGMLEKIKAYFGDAKGKQERKQVFHEPRQTKNMTVIEKRNIHQTYMVLGFKTVPRTHKDSYVLDVLRAHLGRGQSGKLFEEVRTKRGMAYDVGTYHKAGTDYGMFAIHVGTHKKNLKKIKNIIFAELKKAKNIGKEDMKDAKNFLEGEFLLNNEDGHALAETLCSLEMLGRPKLFEQYVGNIKAVTAKDIARAIEKYTKHHTIALIQQK